MTTSVGVCHVDAEQCGIQACGTGVGQTGAGGSEK